MRIFTLLFAALAMSAGAQTLSFGGYDDIDIDANDSENTYDFGANSNCPMNYYYVNSGSQTLFMASEIADMAGKNITSVSYKFNNEGCYNALTRTVKVMLTEVAVADFESNSSSGWLPFATTLASEAVSTQVTIDGVESLGGGEVVLQFAQPYYYAGNNNLVVTVVATGEGNADDLTDGGNYFPFHYAPSLKRRCRNFASDSKEFAPYLAHTALMTNDDFLGYLQAQEAPACSFTYETVEAPTATYKAYVTTGNEDFGVNGVTAYTVLADGTGIATQATTSALTGTVVLVHSALQPSFAQTATPNLNADNLLQMAQSDMTDQNDTFVFMNGQQGAGFYRMATVGAGEAYVVLPSATADFLPVEKDPTAVTDLTVETPTDGITYNMMGQRVDASYRGIVVRDGKKYINR